MSRPTYIYFASKLRHASTFRAWYHEFISSDTFDIVSTWHNSPTIEADEKNPHLCRDGWHMNRDQIELSAEAMIVYATKDDSINGTLVEIGMALMAKVDVYLVGSNPWGSWKHMNNVTVCPTVHAALCEIAGKLIPLPARESLLNDPT